MQVAPDSYHDRGALGRLHIDVLFGMRHESCV